MSARAVYRDAAGLIDINPVYIGKDWGPMRITAISTPDPLTGRVYTGEVYADDGVTKVADMVVDIIDPLLEIIEISMVALETAKLSPGTYQWEAAYVYAPEGPRLAYTGFLEAVRR